MNIDTEARIFVQPTTRRLTIRHYRLRVSDRRPKSQRYRGARVHGVVSPKDFI